MEQLHLGAKWLFRFNAYIILIILSFFIGWFIIPIIFILFLFISGGLSALTIVLSLFVYLILIPIIGEIYARLAYNNWAYEFTDEGFKKEKGIIWKRYSSIPYERIQNVDIHRGVIARMLGFSSLMIHTAGYSGRPDPEGYLPALGIHKAEEIRTFLMKKITSRRR